jgi:hypothetical protein
MPYVAGNKGDSIAVLTVASCHGRG